MIKKLLNKIVNPLLYYVDKTGHSIFRNYCFLQNDGNMYEETFSMQKAGEVLEYRIQLDKYLKFYSVIVSIVMYFILIKGMLTFPRFIFVSIFWIGFILGGHDYCAKLYSKKLIEKFGKYKVVNFAPKLTNEKWKEFYKSAFSKIQLALVILAILFGPGLGMYCFMKSNLNSKNPNYKLVNFISKTYLKFYPKTPKVYDMSAYAKYMLQNLEGALDDYTTVFKLTGRKFTEDDLLRFANLLFIERRLYGSQNAIDTFNDYATRKRLSPLNQAKLLWMKSIFSIENNVTETVAQDYEDLILSLKPKDYKNQFYVMSDKAYMFYLMGHYDDAIAIYDMLISYVKEHKDLESAIKSLYVERGFAKLKLGDKLGAESDFANSKINMNEIVKYAPKLTKQGFIVNKF